MTEDLTRAEYEALLRQEVIAAKLMEVRLGKIGRLITICHRATSNR